jgi:hypothetical protein
MEEKIKDTDDYANWFKWVSDVEKRRQAIFESTSCAKIPLLLQVHKAESDGSHTNYSE